VRRGCGGRSAGVRADRAEIADTGRVRALVGSVALHALLVWLVLHGGRDGDPRPPVTRSVAIRVVDAVEVDLLPNTDGDAVSRAGHRRVRHLRAERMGPARARPDARRERARSTPIRAARSRSSAPIHAARCGRRARHQRRDRRRRRARVDRHARSEDRERADAGGLRLRRARYGARPRRPRSRDRDRLWRWRTIPPLEHLTPPPAPPRRSAVEGAAPRLIYPTRQRDVEDAELFVARVIVDDEGFVAGASSCAARRPPRRGRRADDLEVSLRPGARMRKGARSRDPRSAVSRRP